MWFIGVEVEQETSVPPPKKNPGSAPGKGLCHSRLVHFLYSANYTSLFTTELVRNYL